MDVFNKIRSQVSTVLLGNPIAKEFDILNVTCLAGPGRLWKVFDAKHKSTKQEASVWMLEKKSLDKISRSIREEILSVARKGVVNLTKLRHPKILSVVHPLEESRESLAYATEPVYSSLIDILNQEIKSGSKLESKEQKFYDIEIKYGILQICEGLAFLHNDCKQLHLNLCPETIVVVKSGSWKLAGFEFSISSAVNGATSAKDASGDLVISVTEWQNGYHPLAQHALDYCSPESALQGRALPASDMFSLGLLIYTLFSNGKTLLDCQNDVSVFRKNTNELNNLRMSLLQNLPESLKDYVKLLIKNESTLRPDAMQMTKIPYFNDSSVTTLQSMDNLFQLDNLARSHFYKTLPKFVMSMPKRINLHRILPQLTVEFNNSNMVPFVLPTVLQIADLCTDVEFSKYVLPKIIPVFNMSEPVQIILIILQNLNIMMSKCPEAEFKSYILPMMNKALEVDNRQTQELCLKILPTVAHLMSFSTLKSVIFPRLRKLCLNSGILQMKVSCLICVSKLMEHMDKWFVLDDVLPILEEVKSKEPVILMTILGIYRTAFSHKKLGITKEVLSTKAVPFLLPLATDNNLNLNQYSAFMSLIQQMIAQIDLEHRSKLEKISDIQEEYKSIPIDPTNEKSEIPANQKSQQYNTLMDEVGDTFGFGKSNSGISQLPQSLVQYSSYPLSNENQSSNATNKNLSLEQKQQLASQQEQMSRFSKMNNSTISGNNESGLMQPKLNSNAISTNTSNKPKDLTNTLIERNFAMMSNSGSNWSSSSTNTNSMQKVNYNISVPSNNISSNGFAPISNFNSSYTSPANLNNPVRPMNYVASQPQSTRAPVDLSAFDNLCSLGKSTPKPMNAQTSKPQAAGTNIDDLLG